MIPDQILIRSSIMIWSFSIRSCESLIPISGYPYPGTSIHHYCPFSNFRSILLGEASYTLIDDNGVEFYLSPKDKMNRRKQGLDDSNVKKVTLNDEPIHVDDNKSVGSERPTLQDRVDYSELEIEFFALKMSILNPKFSKKSISISLFFNFYRSICPRIFEGNDTKWFWFLQTEIWKTLCWFFNRWLCCNGLY